MVDYCSNHWFGAISGTFGGVYCWLKETAHPLLFPWRRGDLGLFFGLFLAPSVSKLWDRLTTQFCVFTQQILLSASNDGSSVGKDHFSSQHTRQAQHLSLPVSHWETSLSLENLVCSWTHLGNLKNTQLTHIQVLHTQTFLEPQVCKFMEIINPLKGSHIWTMMVIWCQVYGNHQPPQR